MSSWNRSKPIKKRRMSAKERSEILKFNEEEAKIDAEDKKRKKSQIQSAKMQSLFVGGGFNLDKTTSKTSIKYDDCIIKDISDQKTKDEIDKALDSLFDENAELSEDIQNEMEWSGLTDKDIDNEQGSIEQESQNALQESKLAFPTKNSSSEIFAQYAFNKMDEAVRQCAPWCKKPTINKTHINRVSRKRKDKLWYMNPWSGEAWAKRLLAELPVSAINPFAVTVFDNRWRFSSKADPRKIKNKLRAMRWRAEQAFAHTGLNYILVIEFTVCCRKIQIDGGWLIIPHFHGIFWRTDGGDVRIPGSSRGKFISTEGHRVVSKRIKNLGGWLRYLGKAPNSSYQVYTDKNGKIHRRRSVLTSQQTYRTMELFMKYRITDLTLGGGEQGKAMWGRLLATPR